MQPRRLASEADPKRPERFSLGQARRLAAARNEASVVLEEPACDQPA